MAGLAIFFFGYDQGMMGGVNGARNYYEDTMKFGYYDEVGRRPFIQRSLLQGGIVSRASIMGETSQLTLSLSGFRLLSWDSYWLSRRRLFR